MCVVSCTSSQNKDNRQKNMITLQVSHQKCVVEGERRYAHRPVRTTRRHGAHESMPSWDSIIHTIQPDFKEKIDPCCLSNLGAWCPLPSWSNVSGFSFGSRLTLSRLRNSRGSQRKIPGHSSTPTMFHQLPKSVNPDLVNQAGSA